MDLRVDIQLNGDRRVQGVLKGYDPFLNITLDEAEEIKGENERRKLGTLVIRGNTIKCWENLDKMR